MAAAAAGWRILVQNGVVQSQDPGQAAALLRAKPRGAYTTTITMNGAVILWEKHLRRLTQSIQLLTQNATLDLCTVGSLVDPSLYAGMEKASALKKDDEECIVTVLACTSGSQLLEPKDIFVHIASLVLAAAVPAKLAVMGPGRENPLAKASAWAITRQALENCKPATASEVVLSNDGQHLLEGLVTNFFVVVTSDDEPSGFFIQTAALEDGVLPGVIRQVIIEVCLENGIRVLEAAPSWEDRHRWTEAFVTSCVRILQPVEAIQMPVPWNATYDSEQWQIARWDHAASLQTPHGPVTKMLQKLVYERARSESVAFTKIPCADSTATECSSR